MSQLAEKEGFEPSDPVSQVPSLAVRSIRPLSHFSMPDESDGCQLFHTANSPAALISKRWLSSANAACQLGAEQLTTDPDADVAH